MSLRQVSLAAAMMAALAACSTRPQPPEVVPGPETCDNGQDDNGDGKTDCADPLCFQVPRCTAGAEDCGNQLDDDADGQVDCADADCLTASACAQAEACDGGQDEDRDGKVDCDDPDCAAVPRCQAGESCQNGVDDDGDGLSDCADPDCQGRACGAGCTCKAGVKSEAACADSADNDADGKTDCADGDCALVAPCNGGQTEAGKCNDGLDNDNDQLTDCQDVTDCTGAACGAGCECAAGRKKESACADSTDNDGDQKSDCDDSDCVGAAAESCGDGVDNNCDRAIDCGDSKCTGSAGCASLDDGLPCTQDGQCKGGKCLSEAAYGIPNGACANAASCNVGAQTGCNGGICVEMGSFDVCRMRCTGTGLGASGKCRQGFACLDTDDVSSNSNNYCVPLCKSDADCAGSGTNYGCNPWSKRCEGKDRGKTKYGGPCTLADDCESGWCQTGLPGGYCFGLCSGTEKSCGTGGGCYYYPQYGDNVGVCWKSCANTASCAPRNPPYSCLDFGQGGVCYCIPSGRSCSASSQCCSGSCNILGFCT